MPLRIPKVKSFCCCCSVETGTKIIGYFQAVFLSFIAILIIVLFTHERLRTYNKEKPGERHQIELRHGMLEGNYMEIEAVSEVAFGISLLLGVYKKNPMFIEPYLVRNALYLLMSILNLVMYTILRAQIVHIYQDFVLQIVVVAIYSYIFMVVYNFYEELKIQTSER